MKGRVHGCKLRVGGSKFERSKIGDDIDDELIAAAALPHGLLPRRQILQLLDCSLHKN
jgi:hypothetical protein